jgi:hypothetical protein
MKLRIYDPVVLALDLRHRRFGYAIFQGHRTLLEWGQRVYPAVGDKERELAQRRITKLLDGFEPDLILLKQERWERGHSDPHLIHPLTALQTEAQRRAIPIRLIQGESIKTAFSIFGCSTKAEIAATIASIYPELLGSVPPPRKAWESQHPRMSVFDAIALGVTYWHEERNHIIVDRR